MNDSEADAARHDFYAEAMDAQRLKARISAVIGRAAKAVSVSRDDGTVLLRGRRRIDRAPDASDRRSQDRRRP